MTTQSEYTPTTDQVRSFWSTMQTHEHDWSIPAAQAIFDRWLAKHDRQVSEAAWYEGQDSCSDQYPWEDNPYRKEPE